MMQEKRSQSKQLLRSHCAVVFINTATKLLSNLKRLSSNLWTVCWQRRRFPKAQTQLKLKNTFLHQVTSSAGVTSIIWTTRHLFIHMNLPNLSHAWKNQWCRPLRSFAQWWALGVFHHSVASIANLRASFKMLALTQSWRFTEYQRW